MRKSEFISSKANCFLPFRLLGEGMKHDAALRALMGESKAQQKQRLQERLEKLRKLKQEGGEVNDQEMTALEQVEAEGVDAVDSEVLNHLIEESVTDTGEVTSNTLLNDLQVCYKIIPSLPSHPSAFPDSHQSTYQTCSTGLNLSWNYFSVHQTP